MSFLAATLLQEYSSPISFQVISVIAQYYEGPGSVNFLLSVFGQLSLIKIDRARESLLFQGSTPCEINRSSLAGREPAACILLFPFHVRP